MPVEIIDKYFYGFINSIMIKQKQGKQADGNT
jgi:hypothetical protein